MLESWEAAGYLNRLHNFLGVPKKPNGKVFPGKFEGFFREAGLAQRPDRRRNRPGCRRWLAALIIVLSLGREHATDVLKLCRARLTRWGVQALVSVLRSK